MTSRSSTVGQACAACKYQRRRCRSDCALAPYFPADQQNVFRNAHRLFGVSNILKILKMVPEEFHEEAMRSIIYESNMRERFPVHGCWEVICRLRSQLKQTMEQLEYANSLLAMCKNQSNRQTSVPNSDVQFFDSSSKLPLAISMNNTATSPAENEPYSAFNDEDTAKHYPLGMEMVEDGNQQHSAFYDEDTAKHYPVGIEMIEDGNQQYSAFDDKDTAKHYPVGIEMIEDEHSGKSLKGKNSTYNDIAAAPSRLQDAKIWSLSDNQESAYDHTTIGQHRPQVKELQASKSSVQQ